MADPLVSVVITSYNYRSCVGDAIRSALSQTHTNLEVLVLDNASTDGSQAVIATFSDSRLRAIFHPENIGIQHNHNEGIRAARGEFVLFLSADDMLLPSLVEDSLAHRIAHPEADIIYSSVAIADRNGNILDYFDHPSFDGAESYGGRNELANLLVRDSCMYLPTTLFPRAIFDEIGLLDETLEIVLDYEFDIRMASVGKRFAFFAKPGAIIRFHGENRSGVKRFVATGKQLREFCTILERYTQPRYHQQLAGYRLELSRMVDIKINEMRTPFPMEFAEQRSELEAFASRARASIATVPAIGDAVLRGEGLVSTVLPFAGRIGRLQQALLSLRDQTYDNWEAVVACDTTAADPSGLVSYLGLDAKVRVSRMRKMRGPSATRNLALHGLRGEIIAYLDDDNTFEPNYFASLAHAFSDPSVQITCGRFRIATLDPAGAVLAATQYANQLEADGSVSRVSDRMALNAVAHRRSCLGSIGAFHPGFDVLEDWEFLIRLNATFPIQAIDADACTVCVDVAPGSNHIFGRRNTTGWSEYAARIQDIYNAYPPRSEAERAGRASYAAALQSLVRGGMAAATAQERTDFVAALLGWTRGELVTA